MNILGLDPATLTGFAHSNGNLGTWDLAKFGSDWGDRLCGLRSKLLEAHEAWGIDKLAIEYSSFGSGARHMAVTEIHAMIRGQILAVASSINAKVVSYSISTIKAFATGSGNAKKWQMMRAFKTHFGFEPPDDNMADARFILEMAKLNYQGVVKKKPTGKRGRRSVKSDSPTLF